MVRTTRRHTTTSHSTIRTPSTPHYEESHQHETTERGVAQIGSLAKINASLTWRITPLPPPDRNDSHYDDDHLFPEGRQGKDYFHHYEVSSEESVDVPDHHFTEGKYGVHYNYMDDKMAREFTGAGTSKVVVGETKMEDEDDKLEDSLIAASLVEYDGGL